MSEMTKEDLREVIDQVLDNRSKIDSQTHLDHHYFIASLIKERNDKSDFWDNIKRQVLGWGMIAVIGTVGYHLLDGLREILVHVLNKLLAVR